MSFFSWFSGKSRQAPVAAKTYTHKKPVAIGHEKLPVTQPQRLAPVADNQEFDHKSRRHADREQLYTAIREAMTRAGILSASYKFKVLSLDRLANDFLAMIDLTRVVGDPAFQPGEMETMIVQSARVRYDIVVSGVYWRINEVAAVSKTSPLFATAAFARATRYASEDPVLHEPIKADEVAAFQKALLTASAHIPAVVLEKNVKVSSGLRHSAQHVDFEDTEVSNLTSYPALSNTQYGDLQ